MDYDDNDFQSQNLHLAGEGNTKFPPVLRPYALPKFDFDESLQGHLRFDSLVETEVFLGIESNEDNQWIDAYSRGSSGIEFSSTAAETCSISRHNNVWSEATSSESVEMLLKSVGQEEFIPSEAVLQESDACDELACLAKQMEPNLNPDKENEFKDNVTDFQPPSCIQENLSGSKEDVEMDQSAGVSQGHEGKLSIDGSLSNLKPTDLQPASCSQENLSGLKKDVEMEQSPTVVSQGHDGELSTDGSLSNPKPHDMHRNLGLPASRGVLFTDDKSDDTSQRVETVADDYLDEKIQVDSSASGVTTNFIAASTQNISSSCDVLNIQNVENQVVCIGDEEQSSLQMQANKQDFGSSMINTDPDVDAQISNVNAVGGETHHSEKPQCSIPVEEAFESGSAAEGLETGVSSLEHSSNMVFGGTSDLQKADTCNEDTYSRASYQGSINEDVISIKDAVTVDQSALNTSDLPNVAIKDDSSSESHQVELSNSDCRTCPNFQQNVVSLEKTYDDSSASKEKELLNIGNQIYSEVLSSKSEASICPVADHNASTVSEGYSGRDAEGIFCSDKVDSTNSCILGEATQVCENNKPDEQGDHKKICEDDSVSELESIKAPSDYSLLHCTVDQSHIVDGRVGSSPLGDSLETKLTTSTVSVDVMPISSSGIL